MFLEHWDWIPGIVWRVINILQVSGAIVNTGLSGLAGPKWRVCSEVCGHLSGKGDHEFLGGLGQSHLIHNWKALH